jgi:hypothetical protein
MQNLQETFLLLNNNISDYLFYQLLEHFGEGGINIVPAYASL